MKTWVEAGVVKFKTKFTPKLANWGEVCMFVGYAENNSDGLGHMMNAKNQRIHITCDFMCLNQMYDSKAEYYPEDISTTIFTEKSEDNINV